MRPVPVCEGKGGLTAYAVPVGRVVAFWWLLANGTNRYGGVLVLWGPRVQSIAMPQPVR